MKLEEAEFDGYTNDDEFLFENLLIAGRPSFLTSKIFCCKEEMMVHSLD